MSGKNSVAHALVRAVSALVPTPQLARKHGVETSLDTARTSACATVAMFLAMSAMGQGIPVAGVNTGDAAYVAGTTYQVANPNYLTAFPFNFEGRVDWNLLKITNPSTMWEFVQRGIHNQDDLEDYPAAIADYQKALSLNNLSNGSCQIFKTAPPATPNLTPAPCMFTPRLRLAHLLWTISRTSRSSLSGGPPDRRAASRGQRIHRGSVRDQVEKSLGREVEGSLPGAGGRRIQGRTGALSGNARHHRADRGQGQ